MNQDDPFRPRGTDDDSVWNTPPTRDGAFGPPPAGDAFGPSTHDDAAELASMGVITVGDLLSTTGRAVGANFVPFAAIVLLVTLPGFALSVGVEEWAVTQTFDAFGQPPPLVSLTRIGVSLVQVVLSFVAHAALMYGTVEFMAGRSATFGKSMMGGLSSIGTVVALSFLNTMAIGISAMACLFPAAIVACMLFVAVPAAVVERIGPIEAMQRSAELTQGHRWTIFLSLFVLIATWLAFACVLGFGLGAAGILANPNAIYEEPPLSQRALGYGLELVLSIPLAVTQATMAGVFYARVRGVRDGVDAASIARAFE